MNVTFRPSAAHGTVPAPPSKSMTHRLLIGASLAGGTSTIRGVVPSDDVLATVDCLRALGATITLSGDTAAVTGAPGAPLGEELFCRASASTLRMLTPLLWRGTVPRTVYAAPSLLARPTDVFASLAAEKGLLFQKTEDGFLVRGPLMPGDYRISGAVSSQFVSGLLIALPLLPGDSVLTLLPPVVSRPYLDMTLAALRSFGITVRSEGDTFFIPGGQHYSPVDTAVEGDWSNAAFLDALRLTDGNVRVTGLAESSTQGDRVYPALFDRLCGGYAEIDLGETPDLGPILFVAAALSHGAHFTGTARLRTKESDRIAAMTAALRAVGIRTETGDDDLTVYPGDVTPPSVPLSGAGDHRVVMALSVLLSRVGGTLAGAEAVRKSYPDFFDALRSLGIVFDVNS